MTTPPTTELDQAGALRHQLADQLVDAGHIRTPAVEDAMRTVPRHAFAPEVPAEKAYANDIIATRHTNDGRITSSISAPWLQADMLEAARIQPGHRVLEIGSGGYNAALIAELVGPTDSVTTLDINPAVTDRATRFPSRWEGEPSVRVPERCTEWRWWPLDALPEPIVNYTRAALEAISHGTLYTSMGWT
ncbi:hypothetical protein ACFYO2_47065 [Streptomyces sp. NPDC006602]|uniref:hypothetical protein n=1 Tax=Streptomyces sp. NPDC006602 TaxID=3364751 RepID=UPI00367BA4C3